MANQWKVGDAVKLPSGGPKMTIEQIAKTTDGKEKACCIWIDANIKYDAWIISDALVSAPTDSGSSASNP